MEREALGDRATNDIFSSRGPFRRTPSRSLRSRSNRICENVCKVYNRQRLKEVFKETLVYEVKKKTEEMKINIAIVKDRGRFIEMTTELRRSVVLP